MTSFKCYKCRTPLNQMKVVNMKLNDTGDRVHEYMHIYPDIDQDTMRTIYKCPCGRLCTYMNMIDSE